MVSSTTFSDKFSIIVRPMYNEGGKSGIIVKPLQSKFGKSGIIVRPL